MKIPLNPYAFQQYVNKIILKINYVHRGKNWIQQRLNTKQNSIEVALIPHVKFIQHIT
jgi:hypothetical protein